MNILFLIYHGLSNHSGISKKIWLQIKGLEENNHEVHLCTYTIGENGHRVRMIDDKVVEDYGEGIVAKIKKRCSYGSILNYIKEQGIELVYVRSFHNANPFTVHLFKRINTLGIKSVMEIPTYPYDSEYLGANWRVRLNLIVDKAYRKALAKQMNAIVTFSNEKKIFGQRTICISNGVDFSTLPLKMQQTATKPDSTIHLIGVAEVHYWHGYDRLIHGLGEYYQSPHDKEVYFHIVGGVAPSEMYDTPQALGFDRYIKEYNIEKYVIFHGQQFGEKLNELFDKADFAIGSLGRHRTKITHIKTLKNREYAARGIPFIYSETDEDFDNMPYVLKVPADESAISIHKILQFYEDLVSSPEQIRGSIEHLSWKNQMEKVINQL